jgi:hypothetical protein
MTSIPSFFVNKERLLVSLVAILLAAKAASRRFYNVPLPYVRIQVVVLVACIVCQDCSRWQMRPTRPYHKGMLRPAALRALPQQRIRKLVVEGVKLSYGTEASSS